MARLLTDGAEFGDILFFDTASSLTASPTYKPSGNYGYFLDTWGTARKNLSLDLTEVFIKFRYYQVGEPDLVNGYMLRFLYNANEIFHMRLVNVAGNNFALFIGGTMLCVADNVVIQKEQVYLIEVNYRVHDTTGVAKIRIDGIDVAEFSGDTKPGSDTAVNAFEFRSPGSQKPVIDDIALNDTSGAVDNSWCGSGKVEAALIPSGNSPDGGWSDQWLGSDSNSTDNYALVDEIPPSSEDYVEASTDGYQDRYAVTDFDGEIKIIKRVWVEGRALDVSSSGQRIRLGIRVNSVNYLSDPIQLIGSYDQVKSQEFLVNPDDSEEWEDTDINGTQLIMEVEDSA